MGNQGDAGSRGLLDVAAADVDGEDRAHGGADGLGPVRVGAFGPQRDPGVGERSGAAHDAPHVPGVPNAVEIHANRPLPGERPSAAPYRGHSGTFVAREGPYGDHAGA